MRVLTSVVLWNIIINIHIYMLGSQFWKITYKSKTKKIKICIVYPVYWNGSPALGKGMLHYDVMDLSQLWFTWWLVAPWHQAIDWTNIDIWSTGYSETHFNEILIAIIKITSEKMVLNVSSARYQPFCSGPNVLILKYLCEKITLSVSVLSAVRILAVIKHTFLPDLWNIFFKT